VAENKFMIGRQLPVSGIGLQIDPWTLAGFHMLIVSNFEAETAGRNEIIHGILHSSLGPDFDERPASRPQKVRAPTNHLPRLSLPCDISLIPCADTIQHDYLIDDLATGDTAPPVNTLVSAAAHPNE